MEQKFLAALDRFEEIRCNEKVTATETAVFYRIAFMFRHAGYPTEMAISTAELARQERLSTDMILVIRRRLEELGVIEYRSGRGKGNAARYVLELPNDVPNQPPNELPNDVPNQPPNELPNEGAMPIISAVNGGSDAAAVESDCEIRADGEGGFACARDVVLPTEDSIINININNPIPSEIEGVRGGKETQKCEECRRGCTVCRILGGVSAQGGEAGCPQSMGEAADDRCTVHEHHGRVDGSEKAMGRQGSQIYKTPVCVA